MTDPADSASLTSALQHLAQTVEKAQPPTQPTPQVQVPDSNTTTTVLPGGPVAENGWDTSEVKIIVSGFVSATLGLAVALGAPLNATQETAILGWVGSVTTLAVGYALSRGIRKKGTTA